MPASRSKSRTLASSAAERVICIGGGGHALVTIDTLLSVASSRSLEVLGFVAKSDAPAAILGVPLLGQDDEIDTIIERHRATHFIVAIGSLRGGGGLRPALFHKLSSMGLAPFTAIHPTAAVARSATVGAGSIVMAGAVLQPGVAVGENAIVNTRASIDHGCRIGDHAHIAPGVTCSGDVSVGTNAFIGAGAIIVQGIGIGDNATIGAGSVVLADCAAGGVYVGSPARRLQQ